MVTESIFSLIKDEQDSEDILFPSIAIGYREVIKNGVTSLVPFRVLVWPDGTREERAGW